MKLSLISLLFIVAGVGFAAFLLFTQAANAINSMNIGLGTFLPLLGIILTVAAHRFIKKDEKLVKSMDRLR